MNYAEQYPGNFLEALMLPTDRPVEVEIERIDGANTVKAADGRPIDKPVLRFTGKDRGLVLNKTNARAIARTHGPNMDAWVGKKIGIFQAKVDAFGERDVPAVRVWGAPVARKKGRR